MVDNVILAAILAAAAPLAAFLVIAAFTRKRPALSAAVSIAAASAALVFSCFILWAELHSTGSGAVRLVSSAWLRTGGLELKMGVLVNQLTALMLFTVTLVSLLVQVYSLGYMRGDPGFAKFFAFLSLFAFSMLGVVLSPNLLQLYIFWELVGMCSYLLIGFWYAKPEAAAAGKKAFVVNRVGDFGFLLGILFLSWMAGSFDFSVVEAFARSGAADPGLLTMVALLLFCGVAGKSAQFPLHVWLPDAMEGPTPVSALIHAATMVAAGVFMLARLFGVFSASPDAMRVIAYIGGFTAVFAATIALAQDDIKRVLAYSTLSQLGYMVMVMGCGGYTAGMFHLTTHAFFKALLFLGAGSVIHSVGTNDIKLMGGLREKMPVTAVTFLIASLAISGIFPFSGFWSKDAILAALLDSGNTALYLAALFTAFLTAFYMFRLYFLTFSGPAGGKAGHAHESPAVMTGPLIVLAVLSVFSGFAGLEGRAWSISGFIFYPGRVLPEGAHPWLPYISSAVALSGIALAFLKYRLKAVKAGVLAAAARPLYLLVKNKYYIDELYLFLIRTVFFRLTRAVKLFDRKAVDGAVNLSGAACGGLGEELKLTATGRVQDYALFVFAGLVLALAVFAVMAPAGGL